MKTQDLRKSPICRKVAVKRCIFINENKQLIQDNYELAAHEMKEMELFSRKTSIPVIMKTLKIYIKALK